MDLGFLCEEGVHYVFVLETTFYLVILSCTRTHLMGRFSIDDNYVYKDRKIRDHCYVLCFLLCVVKMVQPMELDNGTRL